MPFFSVRMPRDFQLKNPQAMRNLRLNSRKLTTPFDIHETLKYFLNKDSSATQKQELTTGNIKRGLNLLEYIPPNRTCQDAQIEPHWCSCLNWIPINVFKDHKEEIKSVSQLEKLYTKSAIRIAQECVAFINSLIGKENRVLCRRLNLYSIESLFKSHLNRELIAFKESRDSPGREPVFENLKDESNQNSDENLLFLINPPEIDTSNFNGNLRKNDDLYFQVGFQISFTTWPGQARYELSLTYNRLDGTFKFNKDEISRINSYNQSSSCISIKRPDLRQYCVCR
jgi:hypothetical protein